MTPTTLYPFNSDAGGPDHLEVLRRAGILADRLGGRVVVAPERHPMLLSMQGYPIRMVPSLPCWFF